MTHGPKHFTPQTGGGLSIGGFQPIPRPTGRSGFNPIPRPVTGSTLNTQPQFNTQVLPQLSSGLQSSQQDSFQPITAEGGAAVPTKPPPTGVPDDDNGGFVTDPSQLFEVDLRQGLRGSGIDTNIINNFLSGKGGPGGGGGDFVGGQGPTFGEFDIQDSAARGQFEDIFNRATGGNIQSFDRAQNRLRERTRQGADIGAQQAIESSLGGGRGAFQGAIQNRLGQVEAGRLGALGQGQVGLESQFEGLRLQGLQNALGAAQGLGGLDVNLNQLGLEQSLAGNQFAQSGFQEAEKLRAQTGLAERGETSDFIQGLLQRINEQGGIRGGILTSLGGGL